MEVSFVLSADELYTLLSLENELSETGKRFFGEVLYGAELCDLTGLIEKKLARLKEDELELEPVLRMVSSAISKSSSVEKRSETWIICSDWVTLQCKKYAYHENHWKITPVKGIE